MTLHSRARLFDRTTPPTLFTLMMIAALAALTMTMMQPSLPSMAEYYDTSYSKIQFAVGLYMAVSAVFQLFIGPISDRYGRRPVLLISIALFCLATLGCVLAPTVEIFLLFRMCQAVVVTTMVLSRAVVRDMFSAERSASMIGYVTMGMSIAPLIAPMIGGILEEIFDWRATFVFLLTYGVALILIIWFDLGETVKPSGLSIAGQFREYPDLWRSRRFWGYTLCLTFSTGSFFSFVAGSAFVGAEIFGLSPSQLGIYTGAPALGYILGNYLSGRYSIAIGMNRMVLFGIVLMFAAVLVTAVMALSGLSHETAFYLPMSFVGLGNGMTIPKATAGALSVRPRLAGTAAGLSGSLMIAGGAVMSMITGVLLRPDWGAYPLILMMMLSSVLAAASVMWVFHIDRIAGPLIAEPGEDQV